MARKPQRPRNGSEQPTPSLCRRPAARRARRSSPPSWRCSPRSASSRSASATSSERAGVSLADSREEFGSTLAILAAHMKQIDRAVLGRADADMAEEPPRERLFDVLMRRIEIMTPHKEAVRSLMRSASRNPGLGFALNGLAVRSQAWMLTAANIDAAGTRGAIRAQGPRGAIRLGAAHLARRRGRRPRQDDGGARSRARARATLLRHAR